MSKSIMQKSTTYMRLWRVFMLAIFMSGTVVSGHAIAHQYKQAKKQPRVVASTSWVAAFVKAAGIKNVAIVAPANLPHPPDYDPKPSDLTAIAKADYVFTAGFEGFANRMREASGSKAKVIVVDVKNKPENIKKQVRKLAHMFGTEKVAEKWIANFDKRIAQLQQDIAKVLPKPAPKAVSHVFMAYWVPFSGMQLIGKYGPKPMSAKEYAGIVKLKPNFIVINGHMQSKHVFDDIAAKPIVVYNFPPENKIDLIAVFERNAQAFIKALEP